MTRTTEKYINLFTDFGFKKLFGEEPNKDLLISFLNELLRGKEKIEDLTYLKNERLGNNQGERKAVYDLYCSNERDEKFIVEIQRVKQEFFKDRSVYYATFAIQEQAVKGRSWQYELNGVYTIAILDFSFDVSNPNKLHHRVKLLDEESCQVFYDKLSFIYVEVPKFQKQLHQLENDYEKWLFAFKNLHKLENRPPELEAGIFKKLFELAEIAKMDEQDRSIYHESLKDYWDLRSAIKTYYQEGFEEGEKQGEKRGEIRGEIRGEKRGEKNKAIAMAKMMLREGEATAKIVQYTGLSPAEIEALKK